MKFIIIKRRRRGRFLLGGCCINLASGQTAGELLFVEMELSWSSHWHWGSRDKAQSLTQPLRKSSSLLGAPEAKADPAPAPAPWLHVCSVGPSVCHQEKEHRSGRRKEPSMRETGSLGSEMAMAPSAFLTKRWESPRKYTLAGGKMIKNR